MSRAAKRIVARGLLALAALSASPAHGGWTAIRGAQLNEERYYDGDSFELRTARSRRMYRLYFVDAPETDLSFPDRVQEQADYWRISIERTLELGEEARRFVREFARGGVTVHHRREDAAGRTERTYGLVEAGGRWLDEALVEAGLARLHGKGTDLPDGIAEHRHWARLRAAERRAKEAKVGAWSDRRTPAERLRADAEIEPGPAKIRRDAAALNVENRMPRVLGVLRAGREVEVVRAETPAVIRIRYATPGGPVEALVSREDLER